MEVDGILSSFGILTSSNFKLGITRVEWRPDRLVYNEVGYFKLVSVRNQGVEQGEDPASVTDDEDVFVFFGFG